MILFCRTFAVAALVWVTGCQTSLPAPDSRRARHEQSMEFTLEALREREAHSPDNLWATERKFEGLLMGKPESANATLRKILEQD